MTNANPSFQAYGEQAILISWDAIIAEDLLVYLLQLKKEIEKKYIKQKVEVINTFNSLLINYNYSIENIYGEIPGLKSLVKSFKSSEQLHRKQVAVPVCYDEQFGIDLDEVSQKNKLSKPAIVERHTVSLYTVFFIGFLPGFLYLGGLDKRLFCDRKKTPRLSVEKGAVGIGGKQTGIYPESSAGGWQIIGNCPLALFDKNHEHPSPFRAGDKLKFEAVSLAEYNAIKEQVKKGTYRLKTETYVY